MTPDDVKDFKLSLRAVSELFNADLTPAAIELYFRALEELSLDEIRKALTKCVRTSTFMPRPAEIRAAAMGAPAARLEAMIDQARDAARHFGYAQEPTLPALTAKAIRSVFGSWGGFCAAEWTTYEQHRFKECLAGLVECDDIRPFPELTQADSVALLTSIRERADATRQLPPPPVKPSALTKAAEPFDEEARLAELKRQAAELLGTQEPPA